MLFHAGLHFSECSEAERQEAASISLGLLKKKTKKTKTLLKAGTIASSKVNKMTHLFPGPRP